MILQLLFLALLLVYAFKMFRYWRAWQQIPGTVGEADLIFFSVIIPVRNEAKNILHLLHDLERQSYPISHFEVLVIDDHSDDATPQLVQQFQRQSHLNLKLLFLASFPEKRQKKAAVETGIRAAKGEWIACTDGDCRIPPHWLRELNKIRYQRQPKLISGPVVLTPSSGIFQDLQALEFTALIGVGAASIQLGEATMCNGANIAYEKAAFFAVNGFAGNEKIASGDDEFLLHKIHQKYPRQIAFAKAPEAIVGTPASGSLKAFLQQRVRWASKWRHYQSTTSQVLAVLVLGANVAVFWAFLAAALQQWNWLIFMVFLLLKLVPDAMLLSSVLGFFQKKRLLSLIGLLQLVYLPYILATALLGLTGKYNWKGRNHTAP